MKEAAVKILDNKAAWLGLGALVGAIFGDKAAGIVNTIGTLVMAVI